MHIVTFQDDIHNGTKVMLRHEDRYVETLVTDEVLTSVADLKAYKEEVIRKLLLKWNELYGGCWKLLPAVEGAEREFTRHETIEGEVVVKEIESA